MNCPNCENVFVEKRDTAYCCDNCGWLTQIDGKWVTCPEPVKVTEPEPKKQSVEPTEPVRDKQSDNINVDENKKTESVNTQNSNRRSYLCGLITVTEVEDEDNGDNS